MTSAKIDLLMHCIAEWTEELGFADFGVSDVDLSSERDALTQWLEKGYHADMSWMENNSELRLAPDKLFEGCVRILSVRMNYLPDDAPPIEHLKHSEKAYVSRYALGRDYHKMMRKRLATLAQRIESFATHHELISDPNSRAFVDSAPVLERAIAQKAGTGWVGKHTLLLTEEQGSWFFLGELMTNIPLNMSTRAKTNKCGDCKACLQICPTDAFPKPYVLDASRCISYLTIEHKGPIPEEFREPMGNRIFGCDDCQLICPWNKIPAYTKETDFQPRHQLHDSELIELFNWSEDRFLKNTEGSAIRRTGYENWLRNIAVGLGNAESSLDIQRTLSARRDAVSPLVREHIDWALTRQRSSRRRKRKIKQTGNS